MNSVTSTSSIVYTSFESISSALIKLLKKFPGSRIGKIIGFCRQQEMKYIRRSYQVLKNLLASAKQYAKTSAVIPKATVN